jgi:hypothetical protein
MTPTVTPERFCDHEVIGKALICMFIQNVGLRSWPTRASLLHPLQVGTFNTAGGHCAPPHQVILVMWYMVAKPCHVSVLRTRVHDPGRAEQLRQCYASLTFRKVSNFLFSCGYLLLAVTSRDAPCGEEVSGCSIPFWAYKYGSLCHVVDIS